MEINDYMSKKDSNKKIVSIKKNTIILDYVYSDKSGEYKIDKDIIDNNIASFDIIFKPTFF